ncbi:hypothetical protein VYU27_008618 [Nannochloropsis oceanica]
MHETNKPVHSPTPASALPSASIGITPSRSLMLAASARTGAGVTAAALVKVAASCHVRPSTRDLKPSKYTFGVEGVEPCRIAFSKILPSRTSTGK